MKIFRCKLNFSLTLNMAHPDWEKPAQLRRELGMVADDFDAFRDLINSLPLPEKKEFVSKIEWVKEYGEVNVNEVTNYLDATPAKSKEELN